MLSKYHKMTDHLVKWFKITLKIYIYNWFQILALPLTPCLIFGSAGLINNRIWGCERSVL